MLHFPLRASLASAALLVSALSASAAGQPAPVESLTLKQVMSRLDQVDFDLQGIDNNIKEFRLDFANGLGKGAAIRVLDIGVALVRDRVQLNLLPQVIGAMQRESRTDSWQRSRQNEMMKRHAALVTRHGALFRVVEGYVADLKEKFGIDLKPFLDALQTAIQSGQSVESVLATVGAALQSGDTQRAQQAVQQATQALSTGTPMSSLAPDAGGGAAMQPPPASHGPNDIVSVSPDPSDPNKLIVQFSDGTRLSVPFRRGPNGEMILTLPDGTEVTLPARTDASGQTVFTLPNGQTVALPGALAGPLGAGGMAGGARPGAGGALPEGVRKADGGYVVTMPDGTERYFPADLTKPGIGTRYLGEKGTRLVEETQEFLDLSPAASGGQYSIRQGESIRWQFAITPTGSQAEAGGTRASFKLTDAAGKGRFTASGWRIASADGRQIGAGAGEEASAVVSESGTYQVEFTGRTAWDSPFRIQIQVPIAVQ